jgi:hypothetical protein
LSVSAYCCVLSGRGLCHGPCPEDSPCLWCAECDLETSTMRKPSPTRAVEPLKKLDTTPLNE